MVEKDLIALSTRARTQLHCVVQKLDITAGVIRSQLAALRHQGYEVDEDFALVLQHAVVTPLYEQTERVRALLAEVCVLVSQREANTHNAPV